MVGWIPPVLKDRAERLQEFSQRLKACHDVGPNDTAFILHYDSGVGDMRPYFWPSDENDQRVKPPALNSLRLTHLFKGPSCYCAWLQGGRYTEAKIGLALRTGGPSGISDACLGQFVAICAEQRCGYFVSLDKFYSHRRLVTRKYIKRKEPLRTLDPFHFVTGDTEDSVKRTGLRQVEVLRDDPENVLRGSRMLLRREDPNKFFEFEDMTEKLLENGLPGEKFWELFVQCTSCNYVMPRHHFPYAHACATSIVEAHVARATGGRRARFYLSDKETDGGSDDSGLTDIGERPSTPDLGSDWSMPDLLEDILVGHK